MSYVVFFESLDKRLWFYKEYQSEQQAKQLVEYLNSKKDIRYNYLPRDKARKITINYFV